MILEISLDSFLMFMLLFLAFSCPDLMDLLMDLSFYVDIICDSLPILDLNNFALASLYYLWFFVYTLHLKA